MADICFINLENSRSALIGVVALLIMLLLLGRLSSGVAMGMAFLFNMLFGQMLLYVKYPTGNPQYWVYSTLLYAAGVVVLWIMYQRSIRELSKYPGPPFWSISRLPITYYLFRGTLPWKIHELHKRYGPVVRVSPNELSYTNLEAWDDIYTKGEDRKQLRKDVGFTPSAATKVRSIKFELDDREHARLRYVNLLFLGMHDFD
jgi:hypothetical protein